jgi:hypothetical protein
MATDSNRAGLAYLKEVTWGTTPASALTDLRWTGESFSGNITKTKSTEIRPDRQTTDLILTGSECSGGFNFELSYSDFDELFEGALWSAGWSTVLAISSATIEFADTGRLFDGTTATTFDSVTTGQWIKITGSGTAANNRFYRITSHTGASGITVVPTPNTTVGAGDTIVGSGAYIRNGVTESSYVFEREHTDATQFFSFSGMVCNTLNLSVSADSIVTGSFDYMGKASTLAQATVGTGGNTDAGTNDVISASSNIGQVYEGAFASLATLDTDLFIQEISFSVANNVRALRAVGNVPSVDIGVGACDVSGSLNVYFIDETMYTKFVNSTGTGLAFEIEDAAGNAYIITFPNVEFSSDAVAVGGQNQDVMENIAWEAIRDANTDCTIQVDRFVA